MPNGTVWTVSRVQGGRVTLSRGNRSIVRNLADLANDLDSGALSVTGDPESSLRKGLIRVFEDAKKDPRSRAVADFGKVTENQALRIRNLIGEDVSGFTHSLRGAAVRKILKDHGTEREALRGLIPVTRQDILRIPEVIDQGEMNEVEEHLHSKRTQPRIRYSLQDNGNTFVVEEVQRRGQRMDVVTMWIHTSEKGGGRRDSPTPDESPDSGAPAVTSALESTPFRASPTPRSAEALDNTPQPPVVPTATVAPPSGGTDFSGRVPPK
ncbi:MAG: hypothetical protein ACC655_05805 [Rhodothermia bacterium]